MKSISITLTLTIQIWISGCATEMSSNASHDCKTFDALVSRPADLEMLQVYKSHKKQFHSVVTDLKNSRIQRIGTNYVNPRSFLDDSLTENLQQTMKVLHIDSIMVLSDGSIKFSIKSSGQVLTGWNMGIILSAAKPHPILQDTGDVKKQDFPPIGYRQIEGDWYIYFSY